MRFVALASWWVWGAAAAAAAPTTAPVSGAPPPVRAASVQQIPPPTPAFGAPTARGTNVPPTAPEPAKAPVPPTPTPASSSTATPAPTPAMPPPPAGFGWLLLQMVLVLLAVCALAYALLRWGLRRFQATSTSRAHGMRVLARLSLEPRRSVYVVEIAGRYFVLGTAEGGLSTLAELDAETAARIERAPAAQRSTFREILLGKRK